MRALRPRRILHGAALLASMFATACAAPTPPLQLGRPAPGEGPPPPRAGAADGDLTIPEIVERRRVSVVNIATTRAHRARGGLPFEDPLFRHFFGPGPAPPERPEQSLGSGVVYRADGLVVTNAHVVEQAEAIVVTLHTGDSYEAEVVGRDPASDVAVIRLTENAPDLVPMPLGRSDSLRPGETVLALGNPFGLGFTVTQGIVSAKGRADLGIVEYEDFIQTDAAINPGNSGGALLDARGDLVGINTAILSQSGGFQGVGFAIPVEMVRAVVDDLLAHGEVRRGWLGVVIQDLTPELAAALGLGELDGVLVADVAEGGPADEAGLARGDVVVEYGGRPVTSAADLRNAVALTEPGTRATLAVVRDGQQRPVAVRVGAQPGEGPPGAGRPGPPPGEPLAGAAFEALSPELRQRLRVPPAVEQGVVVVEVQPGSAAAVAGLQPGDVVLEADRRPVGSPRALEAAIRRAERRVLLLVWREGTTLFTVLEKE